MKSLLLGPLLSVGMTAAAFGTPVSITSFTSNDAMTNVTDANALFDTLTPGFTIEDFEDSSNFLGDFESGHALSTAVPDGREGEIESTLGGTRVGSFSTMVSPTPLIGSGSTCGRLDGDGAGGNECENIALQKLPPTNGQGNVIPIGGNWAINSADTRGLVWDISTGSMFSEVVFALRDPADQGIERLWVRAFDDTDTLIGSLFGEDLGNNHVHIIEVSFGHALMDARIEVETSRNDAFAFDGGAVNVVPLPAAGWMLLAGIGGLVAMRRRMQAT